MKENIITWNPANWVTVVLMAGVGFFVLSLIQKAVAAKQGS
jgi:hypothetical protein